MSPSASATCLSGSISERCVGALLRYGKLLLKEHNIDGYALCAELLLSYATGFSREKLLAGSELRVNDKDTDKYLVYLERCLKNEPVQYIINKREFMSLDFYVNGSVLIPRPDTEALVATALEMAPKSSRILDIGTGSGCVAISLAKYRPDIKMTAIDISNQAIEIARQNAVKNEVEIRLIVGDIKDADFIASLTRSEIPQAFDMVISNPPYIPTGDIAYLDSNVRDYEPILSLDGGVDGLDFYRVIAYAARVLLESGRMLIFEIGAGQEQEVREILADNGFYNIWTRKDLSGYDRVIGGELR